MNNILKAVLKRLLKEKRVFEVDKDKFNETFSYHLEDALKSANGVQYTIKTRDGERNVSFKITRSVKKWYQFWR